MSHHFSAHPTVSAHPNNTIRTNWLVIQPGTKISSLSHYPGDFSDWILSGMGVPPEDALVIRVDLGEPIPVHEPFCKDLYGIVISGSTEMVTEALPWMTSTQQWILDHAVNDGIPVLGICFGHQLLANTFGGRVGYTPDGVELGTSSLTLTPEGRSDFLLSDLHPNGKVHFSHWQSVLALPTQAVRLASTSMDSNSAFRIGDRIWGVQFHPEFSTKALQGFWDHHHHQQHHHQKPLHETTSLQNLKLNDLSRGIYPVEESNSGKIVLQKFVSFSKSLKMKL